jgi:hypothetical protein
MAMSVAVLWDVAREMAPRFPPSGCEREDLPPFAAKYWFQREEQNRFDQVYRHRHV